MGIWDKRVLAYVERFIGDSGTLGCPEQDSDGWHSGNLEQFFLWAKNKMAATENGKCP